LCTIEYENLCINIELKVIYSRRVMKPEMKRNGQVVIIIINVTRNGGDDQKTSINKYRSIVKVKK
jgi:hypothetical protein